MVCDLGVPGYGIFWFSEGVKGVFFFFGFVQRVENKVVMMLING